MIGKLQVWRGEHKKEAQDKMRIGGFVSFDDLDRKAILPSPNRSAARKVNIPEFVRSVAKRRDNNNMPSFHNIC
jgi:hypothetical protein